MDKYYWANPRLSEFGLEINGPVNTIKLMSPRLVYHTYHTFAWSKRLASTYAYAFARNWQLPFLREWT